MLGPTWMTGTLMSANYFIINSLGCDRAGEGGGSTQALQASLQLPVFPQGPGSGASWLFRCQKVPGVRSQGTGAGGRLVAPWGQEPCLRAHRCGSSTGSAPGTQQALSKH